MKGSHKRFPFIFILYKFKKKYYEIIHKPTPDELVQRIKHFREYPMRNLRLEERIDQAYNAIKNLTLLLNQMTQTIQTINSNITPKPQPTPNTAPPQHNQVPPQPTPNTVPPQPVHQA